VDLPARIAANGKRQRFFFETKEAATTFCESQRTQLENFGIANFANLSPSQVEQAVMAFEALKPHGVSLNEVVKDWITRRTASQASITYQAAMDAFLEWRKRSESYVRSIRQTRNRLNALQGQRLNEITSEDLSKAMDGMTSSVRNFTIRILGGLFNFGMKRGYCASNPTRNVDTAQREPTEIEIYTPTETVAILTASEKNDPGLIPYLAVSFFCGLRRSEALRLDWTAIDLREKFVKLPASITKTRKGRHIELSSNALAWLRTHAKEEGRIFPFTTEVLRKRLAALREKHKIRTIKHGARHSFASYWLALHGDIDQLCRFLGHDDPETTFRHYAKAATKREAKKFFAVQPKVAKSRKVIAFPSNAAVT
jgi:integrase